MSKKNIIITGGAGFIGSHVVRRFVQNHPDLHIINVDVLTYAGNLENLKDVESASNYEFVRMDITNKEAVEMADVQQLIRDLTDPDRNKSNVARDALLALKSAAVEPLLAALDHQDTALRLNAAAILLQLDDARALPKLVNLTRDPEERVRSCIASWLGGAKKIGRAHV